MYSLPAFKLLTLFCPKTFLASFIAGTSIVSQWIKAGFLNHIWLYRVFPHEKNLELNQLDKSNYICKNFVYGQLNRNNYISF
jgi:hypothetical protein